MHDVPLADLLRANTSVNVYDLKVGDKICVPLKKENMFNVEDDLMNNMHNVIGPEHNMTEDNNQESDYNRMFVYLVKEGDTLDYILSKYDIDSDDLMDANKQNRIMLKPGSIVIVPARVK